MRCIASAGGYWRSISIANALRLNFELPEELPGIGDEIDSGRDWNELAVETPTGISLIPFGAVSAAAAMQVQAHVAQNPGWLRQRLTPFAEQRGLVVVVDMRPGRPPSTSNSIRSPISTFWCCSPTR